MNDDEEEEDDDEKDEEKETSSSVNCDESNSPVENESENTHKNESISESHSETIKTEHCDGEVANNLNTDEKLLSAAVKESIEEDTGNIKEDLYPDTSIQLQHITGGV